MQVEAYRCDFCGVIKEEKYISGITPVEDLFDKLESYPLQMNQRKTNVHFCNDCYRNNVLIATEKQINRKKDESLYKQKIKELALAFKRQCVLNVRTKRIFTID
jgi:hypothetical protein